MCMNFTSSLLAAFFSGDRRFTFRCGVLISKLSRLGAEDFSLATTGLFSMTISESASTALSTFSVLVSCLDPSGSSWIGPSLCFLMLSA